MSLINPSYFIGHLTIAQLGETTVQNDLNLLINQKEPLFLQAALGYDLYDDFMTGLSQSVVDPIWIALRDGIKFTTVNNWPAWYWGYTWFDRSWYMASRRTEKFVGFANSSTPVNNSSSLQNPLPLVVDSGVNNPVGGQTVFNLSSLAGSQYWIELRGFGSLNIGIDATITNNGQTITLLNGKTFNHNETYFLHFTTQTNPGTASQTFISPIAGYIYYLYQQDLYQQMSSIGVVRNKGQYSDLGNPTRKMIDAWNIMSRDIFILWQYLYASTNSVYANYDPTKIDYLFFKPQNQFSI